MDASWLVSTVAPPRPISDSLRQVVLEAFTPDQLRHIAAAAEARGHLPDWLALELANEVAAIVSTPPLVTDYGVIYNKPTFGWFRRRANRIARARSA